jgi:hypothetical protein
VIIKASVPKASPVQANREQFLDALMNTPPISGNAISQLLVTANATTKGIDVSFSITDATGISSLSLLRAAVMDIKQATVLQTWTASAAKFTWSDTDSALQSTGQAYYWIRLEPKNTTGSESIVGPQYILLNPSLLPPVALSSISASHAAAVNGTVLVTVNVSAIPSGNSVKIYLTGYLGNPNPVAIASRTSSPLQFNLQATGETITIEAVAVSSGGAEASSGPTCSLTLNGAATATAKIQNVIVTQLATGNQVQWPSSIEAGVTGYDLYRGQRGGGFGAATLLIHLAASSVGEIIYLDTAGLTGDFEYFVVADAPSGNSPASDAANPLIIFSSSQIPGNIPANTTNTAFLDSVDAGSNATLRIYGGGGPGTSYTRKAGYGTITRPAGSITGLAYSTRYYVMFNVAASTYLSSTTYSDSLPDGYEWVGTMVTVASGGGGGGGGGGTGAAGTANTPGFGAVTSVTVTSGGYGYGSASVSFSGGGGSGAAGNVFCSGGQVVSVSMTSPGSGYASPPSVSFTSTSPYYGGGGNTNGGQRYVVIS